MRGNFRKLTFINNPSNSIDEGTIDDRRRTIDEVTIDEVTIDEVTINDKAKVRTYLSSRRSPGMYRLRSRVARYY